MADVGNHVQLFVHTAALALVVVAASMPLGVMASFLAWRTNLPGRTFFQALFISLLFVPLYVQAAAWQAGFGIQGWQATLLKTAPWLHGFWGAAWVHVAAAIPWVAALTAMGLKRVEPSLEEHSLVEMGPWHVARRVTLRRAAAYMAAAAVWTAICVAGEMTVTDLFSVRTFAERLYIDLAIGGEPGDAPRLALPGVMTTLAALGLTAWAVQHAAPRPTSAPTRREVTFELGAMRWPATMAIGSLLGLLVLLPAANLMFQAGVLVSEISGQRQRSWSLPQALATTADSPRRFSHELGWSLQLAALSATAAVVVALALAWWSRRSGWRDGAVLFAAALSMAIPGPVVGLTIIRLFDRPAWPWLVLLYDQSLAAPLAALVFRTFGIATLIVRAALAAVPRATWEAAALDGVVGWRQLAYVGLPLAGRPLAAAWLVALALGIGELSATVLVLPPRVNTLALRISTLTHYGVEDRLAGICLAVWAMAAGLAAAIAAILGGKRNAA